MSALLDAIAAVSKALFCAAVGGAVLILFYDLFLRDPIARLRQWRKA